MNMRKVIALIAPVFLRRLSVACGTIAQPFLAVISPSVIDCSPAGSE